VSILCESLKGRLAADTVVVSGRGTSEDGDRLRPESQYFSGVAPQDARDGSSTHVTHLVGDVRGRSCLVVDDMISTGGTIVEAVAKLVEMGARSDNVVAATHGILLGGARAKLTAARIGDVFVTDSIEQRTEGWPQLHVVSVALPLADAIRRLASGEFQPELAAHRS
jgi:ribose-phosphate pyrophosphokinase